MNARQPAGGGIARRRAMAEHVIRQGSVSVTELAETFGVSVMTVHRDLDELEGRGMVRKFRGGASAQASSVFESNIAYRMTANQDAKESIARVVVDTLEPGSSVMLDDSTTALAVARQLGRVAPLTVVTNFLEGMKLLSDAPGIRLMALGGEYHPGHDSFLGLACIDAIEAMRTDVAVVSTSAVSGGYAFHQEQEIVLVKRAMLATATRRVLAIDHTKLRRVGLHRVVPLDVFDTVVIDAGADAKDVEALREQHPDVRIAK
ncbi:DeoR/GlpR family DNA-binding transcription regulator [Streptomyces sp. NPDC051940]|uniref:DeoR/GlpR family DNA-binding transcription regulator n=1 Tax=Streptomyces sp. NPDC051940 TaxID=3155675 RepID=UPI00344762A7